MILPECSRAQRPSQVFSKCRPVFDVRVCEPSGLDFFERNRANYYDALMRVRKSHDLIHWVRFFLSGVAETATKGRDTFQKILALRTEVEHQVLSLGKRGPNARQALNMLYASRW